jgi:ubiquinone biosynthesis protein UbiJ
LTISPLRLPALLAQPERWNELVAAEGDPALHATLAELALTLPWFVEEVCTRAFGRVAGQQVADIGRRLLALPGYAAERFGESFASYVGEEARLAVSKGESRTFAAEIAALAARVDALAARIDALAAPAR